MGVLHRKIAIDEVEVYSDAFSDDFSELSSRGEERDWHLYASRVLSSEGELRSLEMVNYSAGTMFCPGDLDSCKCRTGYVMVQDGNVKTCIGEKRRSNIADEYTYVYFFSINEELEESFCAGHSVRLPQRVFNRGLQLPHLGQQLYRL